VIGDPERIRHLIEKPLQYYLPVLVKKHTKGRLHEQVNRIGILVCTSWALSAIKHSVICGERLQRTSDTTHKGREHTTNLLDLKQELRLLPVSLLSAPTERQY
jgi:hypothetical protein